MGSTLQDKLKTLPENQQKEVLLEARKLIDEELTLRRLREALATTNTEFSKKLNVK